jgi:DNA-binding NarL/FixJ family response regulator
MINGSFAHSDSVWRIIVVEDSEPFRRFLCSILQRTPEWQIIREVSDGFEAVEAAAELKPDLILLDIGLPKLNGIEAARRIRMLSPESRILFVSLETSRESLEEALRLGAIGYVAKIDTARELCAAVEAACEGKRFISSSMPNPSFGGSPEKRVPPDHNRFVRSDRKHEAVFCPDDADLIAAFAGFVVTALEAGNVAIVIATESHHRGLLRTLQVRSGEIDAAIREGRYIPLKVAETLATFMIDGLPDPVRFHEVIEPQIRAAACAGNGPRRRVAACGEGVSILWAQGNPAAAIQLERLWNQLAENFDMDILCGYALNVQCQPGNDVYDRICAEHTAVSSLPA